MPRNTAIAAIPYVASIFGLSGIGGTCCTPSRCRGAGRRGGDDRNDYRSLRNTHVENGHGTAPHTLEKDTERGHLGRQPCRPTDADLSRAHVERHGFPVEVDALG